uniref:TIL domain-containing protein n=1 Tax=Nippostrongylus brasiliensis TaxID=27835 RepID=A0A0N4XLW2_NIPBR
LRTKNFSLIKKSSQFQIHRQIPHYPARNERSARYCSVREYHVICGPEKHCDKSCDNMYSPPNCYHDPNLPKCYFPRCLCKDGFVRDERGYCVWEHECPNRYMEPNGKNSTDDTMMMEFVPFVRPATAHRARKYRHSHHRHRRVQLTPSV